MSTWRQFFKDRGFTSKQRGSASSEWLSIIQSDEEKLEQWHRGKQERATYWRELGEKEHLEGYVQEITVLVSKDKVAVAAKHTSDVAAHLKSGTPLSSNAVHSRGRLAFQRDVTHSQPKLSRTPKSTAKRKSQVSVAQLQEPWKALMEVALALNHDRSVDVPDGSDISHLSTTRQLLYMFALDNLRAFKCDRRQVISKKDASVALSCTVNLACEGLRDYFDEEFLTRAANAFNLPTPENCIERVLDPLQKLLPGHDVRFVLEEVRILKGRYQEQQRSGEAVPKHWEAILDILEHV
ncbi:hypothetical protein BG006_002503 [Podila minutissima]|uniref:Uncharacterized protein n=1 Tax=Podila minutissima TaxID=64525 RepID=A0A9P5VGK9_9FUNG|nr:hypothetical protein BG006_002503 [Podila minutissima]